MSQVVAAIIRGPGTNRDDDAADALRLAGATPRTILINDLLTDPSLIDDADLLVVAGGFSFADALGAGRLLALEMTVGLGPTLGDFVASGRPIIGICNGFQALVRSGLLPGAGHVAALGPNDSGQFECRWVRLSPRSQRCIWTRNLTDDIECPIAHGEGRFTCDDATLAALHAGDRVALTYSGDNPNGSRDAIAGITDQTGLVLGLMPHPENHIVARQHPLFTRGGEHGLGLILFQHGVAYAARSSHGASV
jgi:phosphoribosylformylglycinamidine synthase subunit PurQ / glutaminase